MGHLFGAFKHLLSDFLSVIVFVAVMSLTDNLMLSVASGMVMGAVQIAIWKWRGQKIDLMQWASFGLVVVLGSIAIAKNDPVFAMLKPSIGNFVIGLVMLRPNWMGRYLPPVVTENVGRGALIAWGYVWAALEFALSGANAFIALEMSKKAWLEYSAFVPITMQIGLFLLQYAWLRMTVRRNIRARMVAQTA